MKDYLKTMRPQGTQQQMQIVTSGPVKPKNKKDKDFYPGNEASKTSISESGRGPDTWIDKLKSRWKAIWAEEEAQVVSAKEPDTGIDKLKSRWKAIWAEEEAQVVSAKISASAEVQATKTANDPIVLDENELIALKLINKTGILTDLEGFQAKLASGDKEAAKDALALEKSLGQDGRSLKVDGKITDKTVLAAKALIGGNLPAIEKYQELTGNFLIPKSTPKEKTVPEIQ